MASRSRSSAHALAALVLCTLVAAPTHAGPLSIAPDVSSVHIMSHGKTLFGRLFSPALETPQSKAPRCLFFFSSPPSFLARTPLSQAQVHIYDAAVCRACGPKP
jgi:hypothetical protein